MIRRLNLEIAPTPPPGCVWAELRKGSHAFACNASGCSNGADVAFTNRPQSPDTAAFDVRCWAHSPWDGRIACASCGEICEPEDLRNDFHVTCGRSAR